MTSVNGIQLNHVIGSRGYPVVLLHGMARNMVGPRCLTVETPSNTPEKYF
jgi:hypothetical protein